MFIQARELLKCGNYYRAPGVPKRPSRLPVFAECVGMLVFEKDFILKKKLLQGGMGALSDKDRRHLAQLGTAELPWMDCTTQFNQVQHIQAEWPELKFTSFTMNGADEVAKYQKWRSAKVNRRQIAFARPGPSTMQMTDGDFAIVRKISFKLCALCCQGQLRMA